MKYNCNKTLDYDHEVNRMCKTIPTSPIGKCPNCPLANIGGCTPGNGLTQKTIDIVQKWSDDHPEQPKLTKREYEFLSTFAPCIEGRAIERTVKGLYIVFHHASNDEADGYCINPNLFPFINEGKEWYFDKLLGLEVEK